MKESITRSDWSIGALLAGYVTAPLRHLFTGDPTPVTILTMMVIIIIMKLLMMKIITILIIIIMTLMMMTMLMHGDDYQKVR